MKKILYFIMAIASLLIFSTACQKEKEWSTDYDIDLPVPEVTSASAVRVSINDTIVVQGQFEDITNVTIGGGTAEVKSISADKESMVIKVLATCKSGYLIAENVYKVKSPKVVSITVEGGGAIDIPEEVTIIDFSTKGALPIWTASTWSEARTPENVGYDINDNIQPPADYEHYYAVNDTNFHAQGGGGNAPYGYFNTTNNGAGFDISYYSDPYVSVLINTGDYAAYLSYSDVAGSQTDFNPNQAPGGKFANMESGMFLETKGKWLWYSFSLKDILGGEVPQKLESSGLLIRNPWAYPADDGNYPGFQLNIAKMVITDGPIQKPNLTIFEFSTGSNSDIPQWTPNTWTEVQTFEEQGFDINDNISSPAGYSHYYGMNDLSVNKGDEVNPDGGGNVPYGYFSSTNGGTGFDVSDYDNLYFNFLINTGDYVAFVNYAVPNGTGFDHIDASPSQTANGKFANNENGQYMQTDGKWLWYSLSMAEMLGGKENIPDNIDKVGMMIRNPWAGPAPYPGFQLNIAKVVFSNAPLQN
jgi:hypothetical protein